MVAAKACSTPIAFHMPSDLGNICCSDDASFSYHAIVGALHYLTFMRLDIVFVVSKLSQHMHSPYFSHLVVVKRVFRYINDTLGSGILFQKSSTDAFRFNCLFKLRSCWRFS